MTPESVSVDPETTPDGAADAAAHAADAKPAPVAPSRALRNQHSLDRVARAADEDPTHKHVNQRLAALEEVLKCGGDLLEPDAVAEARAVMDRSAARLRIGADYTVVALMGATGSGKSSLFNALLGVDIAEVGVRRPTTQRPMASVFGLQEAAGLMEWLGVAPEHRRERSTELTGTDQLGINDLILLDLPDHDSIATNHHVAVERLLPMVDLMIWVVDPQKYADDALHSRYLRKLTEYQDVMVLVLNQVDTVGKAATEALREDLSRLLRTDGLASVDVFATSAKDGTGIQDLRDRVAQSVSERSSVVARAEDDVNAAVQKLNASVVPLAGVVGGSVELRDDTKLVDQLLNSAGVPGMLSALEHRLTQQASSDTGWPILKRFWAKLPDEIEQLPMSRAGRDELRRITQSAGIELAPALPSLVQESVLDYIDEAAAALPERWREGARKVAPDLTEFRDRIDSQLAQVQLNVKTPWWWRILAFGHGFLLPIMSAGLLWWLVTIASNAIKPGSLEPFEVAGVPLSLWLLAAGVVLTVISVLTATPLARKAVDQKVREVHRQCRTAVQSVVAEFITGPMQSFLDRHRETLSALGRVSNSK